MKKRVALGMSGGVDSTMCALLLLQQGYEVTGITMSTWNGCFDFPSTRGKGCFGPGEPERLAAAKDACAKLGIPHRIIDVSDEFEKVVLDYFRAAYLKGLTPNPCAVCNTYVKFGSLPRLAKEQGLDFDLFATGHYARISFSEESQRWQLLRAVDRSKDQSYFLCMLSQEQLAHTIFPLGSLNKLDIRALAEEHGFTHLNRKKESQDFLEADDPAVLFPEGSFSPGNILDPSGEVIGMHQGLIRYTIGQRRNLGISGLAQPWYVVGIDAAENTITLGPKELLYKDTLLATGMNWVSIPAPETTIHATARIRLAHEPAPCRIDPVDAHFAKVHFSEPQLSITPGQIVVFYDNDLLLGGGIIG
jgi:tRNA-specific 2-thiouridylase